MDFDGDGQPDLLSGSHCCDPFGFHVFRAKNQNTWESRQTYQVDSNCKFSGGFRFMKRSVVSAADWDGDGIPDLLWEASRGIGVARGPIRSGAPLNILDEIDFRPRPATENEYVLDFAVADWDRDGKQDLLVHLLLDSDRSGIYWYRNIGDRGLNQFAPGQRLLSDQELLSAIASNKSNVFSFCVGDWDGDGWPDVIISRQDLTGEGQALHWQCGVWLYKRE